MIIIVLFDSSGFFIFIFMKAWFPNQIKIIIPPRIQTVDLSIKNKQYLHVFIRTYIAKIQQSKK